MSPEKVAAHSLLASLRLNDKVTVTEHGRSYDMYVSRELHRDDEPFGSFESAGVIVTFGPGRYARRVSVNNLVATKRGRGTYGGGVQLVRAE